MSSSEWWLSALAVVAAVALMVEGVRWLRRQWILVNVEGTSMEPTLRDGDEVLARRTRRFEVGQVVVARAPDSVLGWAQAPKAARKLNGPWWVKRIAAGPGDPVPGSPEAVVPPGHFFLTGDNPAGEDSRRHGPCPVSAMAAVMIRKF